MKQINWDTSKNEWLKKARKICFEDVLFYLGNDEIIDHVEHPRQDRYPGQKMLVLNMNDYVYLVPYAENEREIFLKTIIPSRKATRKYLPKRGGDNETNQGRKGPA